MLEGVRTLQYQAVVDQNCYWQFSAGVLWLCAWFGFGPNWGCGREKTCLVVVCYTRTCSQVTRKQLGIIYLSRQEMKQVC